MAKRLVRDYGRGIPLGKVIECVSKINTGAKYDSEVFKKTIGLNGVGTKAVNALSESFFVSSIRDGKKKAVEFSRGELKEDEEEHSQDDKLFDQDVNEEEDFEIPAFLRRQKF